MKTGPLLGAVLPALLLVACGGEPDKPSPGAGDAGAQASGSSQSSPSTPPAGDASAEKAEQPKAAEPVGQDPKPKRTRRPRINFNMVKALMGNETMAPKAPVEATPELVALGEALYHAEGLSAKSNLSCASCHDLGNYGVDNKPVSPGSVGENGTRNTPTTYNAHRQFRQMWDGRSLAVEDQALLPILEPVEHGLKDNDELVAKVNADEALVAGFGKAQLEVTAENVGVALGAFERTLVTRSRWDDYLEGNRNALTNEELAGLDQFIKVGCTQCHMNRTLGGQMFQKLGLLEPYNGKDTGRMEETGNAADKYMFKVPMLLNVEKTAPYYHDGSIATLEESVSDMAKLQLKKDLTDEQVDAIVTFLKALTGPLPEKYTKK